MKLTANGVLQLLTCLFFVSCAYSTEEAVKRTRYAMVYLAPSAHLLRDQDRYFDEEYPEINEKKITSEEKGTKLLMSFPRTGRSGTSWLGDDYYKPYYGLYKNRLLVEK